MKYGVLSLFNAAMTAINAAVFADNGKPVFLAFAVICGYLALALLLVAIEELR